jgi:hypothetical protein
MWTKGQSGNPYGRPPRVKTVTEMMRAISDKNPGKMAARWWFYAMDEDFGRERPDLQLRALESYADRIDGKARVSLDVTYDDSEEASAQFHLLAALAAKYDLPSPVVEAEYVALPPAQERPKRGRPKGSYDKTPSKRRGS